MTFTKDGIFQHLAACYAGAGGTAEGSFAGDVLRACADAMAELWSEEIDDLARRGFVSGAVGDYLTAVCADRGVVRREGEDDNTLRARTLELLAAQPASGNADHYQAWCARETGILRTKILSCARGPGTVDILAVGPSGGAATAQAIGLAQNIVDDNRPVGADARVLAAVEKKLDIAATVTLTEGGNAAAVEAAFRTALGDYLRLSALRTEWISYARMLGLLLECPGVADVAEFHLNGAAKSVSLGLRETAVLGALALTEEA